MKRAEAGRRFKTRLAEDIVCILEMNVLGIDPGCLAEILSSIDIGGILRRDEMPMEKAAVKEISRAHRRGNCLTIYTMFRTKTPRDSSGFIRRTKSCTS
jgi:hypothetical protein